MKPKKNSLAFFQFCLTQTGHTFKFLRCKKTFLILEKQKLVDGEKETIRSKQNFECLNVNKFLFRPTLVGEEIHTHLVFVQSNFADRYFNSTVSSIIIRKFFNGRKSN